MGQSKTIKGGLCLWQIICQKRKASVLKDAILRQKIADRTLTEPGTAVQAHGFVKNTVAIHNKFSDLSI